MSVADSGSETRQCTYLYSLRTYTTWSAQYTHAQYPILHGTQHTKSLLLFADWPWESILAEDPEGRETAQWYLHAQAHEVDVELEWESPRGECAQRRPDAGRCSRCDTVGGAMSCVAEPKRVCAAGTGVCAEQHGTARAMHERRVEGRGMRNWRLRSGMQPTRPESGAGSQYSIEDWPGGSEVK